MASTRYTSALNGVTRPWGQLKTSHKIMGTALVSLVLLVLFMGHEQYSSGSPSLGIQSYRTQSSPASKTGSLTDRVALTERRYKAMLDARAKFINTLGGQYRIDANAGGETWVLWDFFPPIFDCPHTVERIGHLGDGGKYICGMDIIAEKKSPVIYSFGVNVDSSLERALLQRAPTAQVYGYDFSVSSWGVEIENNPELKRRAHFHPWAVGAKDDHGPGSDPNFQVYTLDTLMKLNGHTWIDILKIDIEGAEFDVLRGFCNYYLSHGLPLPFGQLEVEIHAWGGGVAFDQFLEWFELLERAGLRPFRAEPNLVNVKILGNAMVSEYAFVNINGGHELVRDV